MNAKRVYKGQIFEIYQWRQKMFDGSTKIFERAQRPDVVLIIAAVNDKIIVLKQKQPDTSWYYCIPSGRMDDTDKNPKHTALRELLEETGYKPGAIKLWKKHTYEGKVNYSAYVYVAQNCKKTLDQHLDGGEKIKTYLYNFDRFLRLADEPTFYEGELTIAMLRARADKKYRKKFKKAIFGSKSH